MRPLKFVESSNPWRCVTLLLGLPYRLLRDTMLDGDDHTAAQSHLQLKLVRQVKTYCAWLHGMKVHVIHPLYRFSWQA